LDLSKANIITNPISGKEFYLVAEIKNVGNYLASDVVVSIDHEGYDLLGYCDISDDQIYVGDLVPTSETEIQVIVWDNMDDLIGADGQTWTSENIAWDLTVNTTDEYEGLGCLDFAIESTDPDNGKFSISGINENFISYDYLKFWVKTPASSSFRFEIEVEDSLGHTAYWNVSTSSTNWEEIIIDLSNPDGVDGGNINLSHITKVAFSGLERPGSDVYHYLFDYITLEGSFLSSEMIPPRLLVLRLKAPIVSYEEYHPITIGVNYKMKYTNEEGKEVEENFQEEFKRDINVYPKTVQLDIKQFVSYKKLILGEESDVTVTVENTGDLKAYDLEIICYTPSGLELVEGEASKTLSELSPGERVLSSHTG